uniref:Uncharacterized protein n=1 Tax=Cyanothece sp. (strain PCC 7425 / ATCC 29141) TaxID=395961 RepID=B8HV44_CYAP4
MREAIIICGVIVLGLLGSLISFKTGSGSGWQSDRSLPPLSNDLNPTEQVSQGDRFTVADMPPPPDDKTPGNRT